MRRLFSTKYTKRKEFRKKETKKLTFLNVSRDLSNLNIYYISNYSLLPFKVGSGTLMSTRGAVTVMASLLAVAPKRDLWLAAPPTVTEGSFCVRAQPIVNAVINAPIAINLIVFIV